MDRAALDTLQADRRVAQLFHKSNKFTKLSVDKKVQEGQLRLVLMKSIGESLISSEFDQNALKEMLDEYLGK